MTNAVLICSIISWLAISSLVDAFISNPIMVRSVNQRTVSSSLFGSYEEMLAQARLQKQQQQQNQQVQVPRKPQQKQKKPVQTQAQARPAAAKADNGLPFDDAMYDHLRFVISKLTAKIKSGISLKESEVEKFRQCTEAIIADATGNAVSLESTPVAQNDGKILVNEFGETSDPDDPLAPIHGMQSTWDVPNMEDMTTEEFYDAINRRNAKIRANLRAQGTHSRELTNDYYKALAEKTKQLNAERGFE